MQAGVKQKILKRIMEMENQVLGLNAKQSEVLLLEILSPLLAEEGYKVSQIDSTQDYGIDFIAQRTVTENEKATTIGIQYKYYTVAVGREHIDKIIAFSPLSEFERIILLTNSQFTDGARELARRTHPVTVELMDIGALKTWLGKIDIETDLENKQFKSMLQILNYNLARLVAENPLTLDELEWRDLERLLAEVFTGIGFDVELTPGSKDGGKDIILNCKVTGRQKSFIVEIKHWRSGKGVGHSDIKDFLNVVIKEGHDSGLYVSTYGYTHNAFESLSQIERQKIKFGNKEKIITLCNTYTKFMSGIWSPAKLLPDILFEQTI